MENLEKLAWEFLENGKGWVVLGSHNLDEDGDMTEKTKEIMSIHGFETRQIPAHKIGQGDSTGICRILLDADDDETMSVLEKMSKTT